MALLAGAGINAPMMSKRPRGAGWMGLVGVSEAVGNPGLLHDGICHMPG